MGNQHSQGDDDDDWGSDEADNGQQRIEELTEAAKKLMASEELEKSTEERLEIFYKFVEVSDWNGSVKTLKCIVRFFKSKNADWY